MKGRKRNVVDIAGVNARSHRPPRIPIKSNSEFEPPYPLGEIGMAEWKRIRAEAPWISAASAGALWLRCQKFEDMMAARQEIERDGSTIKTAKGLARHPALLTERECAALVMRADVELGLTACSEQKMSGKPAPVMDALEAEIG